MMYMKNKRSRPLSSGRDFLQLKGLGRGQSTRQGGRRRFTAHGVIAEMAAVEVKGHGALFHAQHFVAAKIAGVLAQGADPAGRFIIKHVGASLTVVISHHYTGESDFLQRVKKKKNRESTARVSQHAADAPSDAQKDGDSSDKGGMGAAEVPDAATPRGSRRTASQVSRPARQPCSALPAR